MVIRTPDHRLRVFVSSTLKELAGERKVVRQAILKLRLAPVMFESGARPHPAQDLYKSYLSQSQIFIAIYWQSYGWVAPGMSISGLEDEYRLSARLPRLIYIKNPAPAREPALKEMLDRIRDDNLSSYTYFSTLQELNELVQNDLALMLTEKFETSHRESFLSTESDQHPPTNVPMPRNPLIGRESVLATAHNMLLKEDIALITLTGAGGTGKSRLVLQIGIEMREHFKDGVYLVRLESINSPDLVIATIAETIGIREAIGSRPIKEMLKDFLRDKQMLLLLDNFEQVLPAASQIAELLEACPQTKSVITSRIPLHLRAEKELSVPPLPVPMQKEFSDFSSFTHYAAVELFIQRAKAIKSDFSVTDVNAPAIAEICYRLDGLPLAIELAAARIKMLTPHELLSRLGHRFDLLRSTTRDLPERQRTLRGTIDWSYNLLEEREKKLFRRLSVFVGGWSLEAAETVCDLNGDFAFSLDDALASLIDNNLALQYQDVEEHSYYGMLVTIREYAYERLVESDELDKVRNRHAQYYLEFVKMIEPRIRSAERVRWNRVLLQEVGNIRAVLEWIYETGNRIDIGQQLIITLGLFWVTSGYSADGKQLCIHILSKSDESTPIFTRAGLLSVMAWIFWAQGEQDSVQAYVDESLDLYRSQGKIPPEYKNSYALALIIRGLLAYASRDLPTATANYESCIELLLENSDQWLKVLALSLLGDIAVIEDDRDRAMALHNQSIMLARQQGDPWCLMSPLMSSGQYAVLDGDLVIARQKFIEVESLLRKTGDRWSLSSALNDLGHVYLLEGNFDQASIHFSEGLNLANNMGNRRVLLIILTGTAVIIAKRAKELPNTHPKHHEGLTLAGRICGATEPFIHLPGIFVWSDSKFLYEADINQVKLLLGTDLWDKNYIEGQDIPLDQAVDLAIQFLKE